MATPVYSGTTDFDPSVGDMVIHAFARCGIRRTALTSEHMQDARMAVNLMLSQWSNLLPLLWKVELGTVALAQGDTTLTLTSDALLILDAYLTTTSGGTSTDRIMYPISRTDYAAFPDKTQQGTPTVFWFNRQIIPQVKLWQVPDASSTYSFKYYYVRQVQDANLSGGQNPQVPYRFFDALAAGLAARLAEMYAPDRCARLDAMAEKAWQIASQQDEEMTAMYISPGIAGYMR